MPELLVTMTVQFESPAIYTRWAPIEPGDRIDAIEQGISISLVHKIESTWWAFHRTKKDIERLTNVSAHRIFVEARHEISEELAAFILAGVKTDKALADEYLAFGWRLQTLIVKRLNRFAEYVGAIKGQYWIDRFQTDEFNPSQFFIAHGAQGSIGDKAVEFDPQIRTINIRRSSEEGYITKDDWPAIRDFVASEKRVPLVHSLIANAYRLASQGLRRNALVDAVTALEVALNDFARNAPDGRLARFQPAIESQHVSALIEKVGLRGAFGVAIPLLLAEEEFPADLLGRCRTAIEKRNMIVHQGARDVDPVELNELLAALKHACCVLTTLNRAETPSTQLT